MSQRIEPNRVPAEPIVQVIRRYLDREGDRIGDGSFAPASIHPLAERVDMHGDTLFKILSGHTATIDFDIADRLLCATNQHDLWLTDLNDIYQGALLYDEGKQFKVASASGAKVCARRGCSAVFIPVKHSSGRQIYCSNNCRTTAWKHRTVGVKTVIRGKDRALEKLVCRKGHERTPENTGTNSHGRRYCLICHRASQRRWEDAHRRQKLIAE